MLHYMGSKVEGARQVSLNERMRAYAVLDGKKVRDLNWVSSKERQGNGAAVHKMNEASKPCKESYPRFIQA